MSLPTAQKHIVAFSYHAWGHTRPLVHLAARLVKLREVNVTLLIMNSFYDRVQVELSRSFDAGEDAIAQRIRIVCLSDVMFLRSDEGDAAFENAWKALVDEKELRCAQTGIRYMPLPKPRAVILDLLAVEPFYSIKTISGDTVKVYTWMSGMASAIFHICGPEHPGGNGNVRAKAEEEALRTGRPYKEVILGPTFVPQGKVISTLAGMIPMYDHEYAPQEAPIPEDITVDLFPRLYETIESADGTFLCTPEIYEPKAVAAVRDWYAQTGRPVHACGPLLPAVSKSRTAEIDKKVSSQDAEIQTFLDGTFKTSGPNSLLYISFGTVFWPAKNPEALFALLDIVMECNIPFILGTASPMAIVPEEFKAKLSMYGKGLMSPWTPQQLILDHPATGWFLTHGGHNSILEAISAGVPVILWPFTGDQPVSAAHATYNLQIGYELFEVRTGHGLKPIHRTGKPPTGTIEASTAEARDVLTKAFGEDGSKKRENVALLKKSFEREWEADGVSKRDVIAFLDSLETLV